MIVLIQHKRNRVEVVSCFDPVAFKCCVFNIEKAPSRWVRSAFRCWNTADRFSWCWSMSAAMIVPSLMFSVGFWISKPIFLLGFVAYCLSVPTFGLAHPHHNLVQLSICSVQLSTSMLVLVKRLKEMCPPLWKYSSLPHEGNVTPFLIVARCISWQKWI